jgi:hypothetical protein
LVGFRRLEVGTLRRAWTARSPGCQPLSRRVAMSGMSAVAGMPKWPMRVLLRRVNCGREGRKVGDWSPISHGVLCL